MSQIDKLKELSLKDEPMRARTVRLPPELDQELRDFCGKSNIRFSVLYREIARLGWERLKEDSQEIRELVEGIR